MGSFQVGDTSFLDKEFVKNGMKTLAVHTVQGLAVCEVANFRIRFNKLYIHKLYRVKMQ